MKSTQPVPIIAVKDVVKTAKELTSLFSWVNMHKGSEFAILMTKKHVPTLMLHEYDAHEHRRFRDIHKKAKGIGQSLYVFVEDIEALYRKVKRRKLKIVEPLFSNQNSGAQEFTFQIKEGYQFSACDTDSWLYYWVKRKPKGKAK